MAVKIFQRNKVCCINKNNTLYLQNKKKMHQNCVKNPQKRMPLAKSLHFLCELVLTPVFQHNAAIFMVSGF